MAAGAEEPGFLACDGDGGEEPVEPLEPVELAPGLQNSLMVTVWWLVATSVTTTLMQPGDRSGRQSGSVFFRALLSAHFSAAGWEVAASDARVRRHGFLFPP